MKKKNDLQYEITFTVENISEVDGGEVAQLYVRNVNKRVIRPDKELRRYQKVYLKAGEKKKISFLTDKDCFEYYSICHGDWHVDEGRYELLVCRDAETVEFLWKVCRSKPSPPMKTDIEYSQKPQSPETGLLRRRCRPCARRRTYSGAQGATRG